MTQAEVSIADQKRQLEDLVLNSPELKRIDAILREFNLFEAVGVTRQELRHSDFLAFLLNPSESHGLADTFLRRFLQRLPRESPSSEAYPAAVDLEFWNLQKTTIHREWQGLDLFVRNDDHDLAVIIENKVGSGLHDDQLHRYMDVVRLHYPLCRNLIALYLTPGGNPPDDERYTAISYHVVAAALRSIIEDSGSAASGDLRVSLRHYLQLLERHVIENSEIAALSRQIYQKYQKALDLIFEHRPDRQADICGCLNQLVAGSAGFDVEKKVYKYLLRFGYTRWDDSILSNGDGTWTESKRMLLFEFKNNPEDLKLTLTLGPGPRHIRENLVKWAWQRNGAPFGVTSEVADRKWIPIWSEQWFRGTPFAEQSFDEDLKTALSQRWDQFLAESLPRITTLVDEWLAGQSEAPAQPLQD